MPTLVCKRERLFELLGSSWTDEAFEDLCFQFGVELDEVTSEQEMAARERFKEDVDGSGNRASSEKMLPKSIASLSTEVLYKIDLPANRYDLLCVEGFAIALNVFLRKFPQVPAYTYTTRNLEKLTKMVVGNTVKGYRDYVVCALLRDIAFTKDSYASFIDFQEKFHQNLARKRTLVSVGTHDFDTLSPPFRYDALPKEEIRFIPLKETQEVCGVDFIEFYRNDLHLNKYLHMIENRSHFLVIRDQKGTIMSLPPIINSKHSAISLATKNIFIEATATDQYKATVLVNQLVCAFSFYCRQPFTIEPVIVQYEGVDGHVLTPDINPRQVHCSVDRINRNIGISLSAKEMAESLTRMMLTASTQNIKKAVKGSKGGEMRRWVRKEDTEVSSKSYQGPDSDMILVLVPPTRSDVLHECDIMEDVAISYGYDNIKKTMLKTVSYGKQNPLSKLTHMVRSEIANCGYIEALTLSLTSFDEGWIKMRMPGSVDGVDSPVVRIANPQTKEFQMVRVSLLPGLLKTLCANRSTALPIQIFEVSDVVIRDSNADVGARNQRNAAAIYCSSTSGFEIIHGLLDHVLRSLGATFAIHPSEEKSSSHEGDACCCYYIKPSQNPSFFEGRQANVVLYQCNKETCSEKVIGTVGIVHPEILKSFQIHFPVSAFEINLHPFL